MNSPPRKRLLFVEPTLQAATGGAPGVAAWMLQALCEAYEVTVLTWRGVDIAALNRHFGTALRPGDLRIRTVHPLLRRLIELDPDPQSLQKNALALRLAKRMRRHYDLLLTAQMESDFAAPGIQYVHYPWLAHLPAAKLRSRRALPWWRKPFAAMRGKIRPWMLLSDYSFERMKANLTLTNSQWTRTVLRRAYGIESVVVYPPAAGDFPDLPWEERENGFVVLGRLDPDKHVHWIIETMAVLHNEFPDLRLHIIGVIDPLQRDYHGRVARLAASHGSWITLHEDLPREDLARLLSRQRYGIHARVNEHFGMAIAEMLRAGCIPFVHRSGGAVEIVNHDARLTYEDRPDAIGKIRAVLRSPERQRELRARLAQQAARFTPERFMREIRTIVAQRLSEAARRVLYMTEQAKMTVPLDEKLQRLSAWLARANDRPLIGFTLGSYYPLHRYPRGSASLPDGLVEPGDLVVANYLDDSDELYELHERAGGDLVWSAAPFFGVPWIEASLGCGVLADHVAGSTRSVSPASFAARPVIPRFSAANPWVAKMLEFIPALAARAGGRYPVGVTLMRGVSDLLSALYGANEFVLRMVDDPGEVHGVVAALTEYWIDFGRCLLAHLPQFHGGTGSFLYNLWCPGKLIWLQEDAAALLSPALYEEFIYPADCRIADAFENTVIHLHPSRLIPSRQLAATSLAAIELHIDHDGPRAAALEEHYRTVLARKPLFIWGDVTDADLDFILTRLPHPGLAVSIAVNSVAEARRIRERAG